MQAPRAERGRIFLSTPSARRTTGRSLGSGLRHGISIHALCEEDDGARNSGPL